MFIPLSYSKYSTFTSCPIKYAHSYLWKTKVDDDLTYPLVLGTLTHLFIKLYNDGEYTKNQLRDLKSNTDKLYDLIELKYPAINKNGFEIKSIDKTSDTSKMIDFIGNNEAVFFQALKFFNNYKDQFFSKVNRCNSRLSETTFHNIVDYKNNTVDLSVCLYGSIDLLMFSMEVDKVKYLIISDHKTGKSLYDSYYEQLFFYAYNLLNYNAKKASLITNNTDDISILDELTNKLNTNLIYLILFNVRDGEYIKLPLSKRIDDYDLFIENMHNNISSDILYLHINKDDSSPHNIFREYSEKCNIVDKVECRIKDMAFICKYCKFKEICDYRKKENNGRG